MEIINYFSLISMPLIIGIVLLYGLKEKLNIFEVFIEGAEEGIKIIIKLFPTLLGLFVAIGLLRASGLIDLIIYILNPLIKLVKFPPEIVPLALLRPISGSSSIAIATDIMKEYGVDSKIGLISSVIMGSTETTIYTIAIYTSVITAKKANSVLYVALLGDLIGISISIIICNLIY